MSGSLLVTAVRAEVRIAEFLADNLRGLTDEEGQHEDWIELWNSGTNAISLEGWHLTDKSLDLTKWRFPSTNLLAGQRLVVFASGKNRRLPGSPLHTNFKLDLDGEYLGLVHPDGVTVASAFSPAFPPQATDVSYGFPGETVLSVLRQGSATRWRVWTNDLQFQTESPGWNSNQLYSTIGWSNATSGLGWDDTTTPVDFSLYYGSNANPRSMISGQARSLFVRFLPVFTNLTGVTGARLKLRYDDGVGAWLNGALVAADLMPAAPSWNSTATGVRTDSLNAAWAVYDVDPQALLTGTNVLACQVFNANATSSDLLLALELDLVKSTPSTAAGFLATMTPGVQNSGPAGSVEPRVEMITQPARPPGGAGSPPLGVRVEVTPALGTITNVTLLHRTMHDIEIPVLMSPVTGGVYTASVPTSQLAPGQMVRWRIEARDSAGGVGTGPRYADANDDDRYYGTVAANAAETVSLLPLLHWFPESLSAAASEAGGRYSFFHLGRFYDNVRVNLHGQSTSGFAKKGHNLDFNAGNRFVWREGQRDAKDVKILSNWADKSKVRNTLSYEMLARSGVPGHWAFPVRVQTNGVFYAILDMVEDGDDRFLERVGLDPDGALYKVYLAGYSGGVTGTNTWNAEKKTRRYEGNSDLAAFSSGVSPVWPMSERRRYAYDNLNLAALFNYLAALVITSNKDQGHKNFYLYRDSNASGEWQVLPWDVDLSLGHDWMGNYFDDQIRYDQPLQLGQVNYLKEVIFQNPELNQAFLRRLRSLMDTVLQPAGTPPASRHNEQRIPELLDLMDPPGVISDADMDFTTWGWWTNSTRQVSANPLQEMRPQAQRIIDTFFPGRRSFLQYNNPTSSGAPIPASQPVNIGLRLEVGDYNPAGGLQEREYLVVRNTNAIAADISGWSLSGGVEFTFPPGTVIPSPTGVETVGQLFVARQARAFRQRTGAPGGGQFCFVTGPYAGELSARGETIQLRDPAGRVVAAVSYSGNPSPAQRFLRISEVMFNPTPWIGSPLDPQEFEYVELTNISTNEVLDLGGVRFVTGIGFEFQPNTLLGPGQNLVLARNPAVLTARHGPLPGLSGPYDGYLDNGGERLVLLDAVNEEILDFTYRDSWWPMANGLGFSLVTADPLGEPDKWSQADGWRLTGVLGGSPGHDDPPPVFPAVFINEVLAHTDPPLLDAVEIHNASGAPVNVGGWFLTDDLLTPRKYRIPEGTTVGVQGFLVVDADDFDHPAQGTNRFLLSSMGDEIWLVGADPASSNFTGFLHGFRFGPQPNAVALGRHVVSTGDEHLVPQRWVTLGTTNAGPAVGPVVVRSLCYRPPDLSSNGVPIDNALDEFIELVNVSSSVASLYDPVAPTNVWRLDDAVRYNFPSGITLQAGARLLVAGFDPANASMLAAFRSRWAFPGTVPVFGPWDGKLDNSADDVQLLRPDTPNPDGTVPYLTVDRVRYLDHAPWPIGADGYGAALARLSSTDYGDDPVNWTARPPAGASVSDADGDGLPTWWEVNFGLDSSRSDADLDSDSDGLDNSGEFRAGTDPTNRSSVLWLDVRQGGIGIELRLLAQPEVAYLIETSPDLSQWTPSQTIQSGFDRRWMSIPVPSTGTAAFFRVRIIP